MPAADKNLGIGDNMGQPWVAGCRCRCAEASATGEVFMCSIWEYVFSWCRHGYMGYVWICYHTNLVFVMFYYGLEWFNDYKQWMAAFVMGDPEKEMGDPVKNLKKNHVYSKHQSFYGDMPWEHNKPNGDRYLTGMGMLSSCRGYEGFLSRGTTW